MRSSTFAAMYVLLLSSLLAHGASAEEEQPPAPPSAPPAQPPAAPSFETATPPAAIGPYPRIGGHLGFAVPIVSFSSPTTVIGSDFVAIGLTPGITAKLSEHWSVDFEFIAVNEVKNTPAAVTWVVDPGVVYAAGAVSAGMRVATKVGASSNIGLVPILVLPVLKISETVGYYIEGDVPAFLYDGGTKVKASVGFQFQSGFSF